MSWFYSRSSLSLLWQIISLHWFNKKKGILFPSSFCSVNVKKSSIMCKGTKITPTSNSRHFIFCLDYIFACTPPPLTSYNTMNSYSRVNADCCPRVRPNNLKIRQSQSPRLQAPLSLMWWCWLGTRQCRLDCGRAKCRYHFHSSSSYIMHSSHRRLASY